MSFWSSVQTSKRIDWTEAEPRAAQFTMYPDSSGTFLLGVAMGDQVMPEKMIGWEATGHGEWTDYDDQGGIAGTLRGASESHGPTKGVGSFRRPGISRAPCQSSSSYSTVSQSSSVRAS